MESNENANTRESGLLVSTAVLLPGTRLTFQFDEPERRALVEEALYRDGHLVAARTESGELGDGLPPVATLAEILDAARPTPESLIAVLGGVERIEPEEINEDVPAPTVTWAPLEEVEGAERRLHARARDVLGLLHRIHDQDVELAGALDRDLTDASPSKVADVIGSVAFQDVDTHQELLEELNVFERLGRIEEQLDELLSSARAEK